MAREKNTHTKIKTATEHHTRPINSYFSSTPTPAATRPSRPKTGLSLAAKPSSVQGVKPIASFFSATASNSASLRSYLQTDNDDHDNDDDDDIDEDDDHDEDDAATKVQYCPPKDDDWLVDSNELPEMPAAAAKKPSTLEELKQFPGHKRGSPVKWAVYLVILEKPTERPALYIGATTSNDALDEFGNPSTLPMAS
ncbi:1,3-beta-glucanosyltransferase [Neurospora sp. IMI 360204]|nr:1,3-beta-glucanosyltransferase [Neurospora sp. IMI 360204]